MTALKKHALPVFAVLNGVLALALVALWLGTGGQLRHIHWQRPAPQTTDYAALVPSLPGLAPAQTGQFVGMLERPLFSPTRRPPPPAPVKQDEAADDTTLGELTGLMQGQGSGGAIVQIAGKPRRVQLNESVEGWKLTAVQERSATFTRAGQSRVLQLPRAKLQNGPALPPPQRVAPPLPAVPAAPAAIPSAMPSAPPQPADPAATAPPVAPASAKPAAKPVPVFGGSIR